MKYLQNGYKSLKFVSTRTMFQHSKLKLEFWAETLQMAVYMINLLLSKAIRLEVPQSLWSGKQREGKEEDPRLWK